jgi:hypothetical protein
MFMVLCTLQVNLKLFAPEPNRRRTVLLFVIRDKTRTPLNKLVEVREVSAPCTCAEADC